MPIQLSDVEAATAAHETETKKANEERCKKLVGEIGSGFTSAINVLFPEKDDETDWANVQWESAERLRDLLQGIASGNVTLANQPAPAPSRTTVEPADAPRTATSPSAERRAAAHTSRNARRPAAPAMPSDTPGSGPSGSGSTAAPSPSTNPVTRIVTRFTGP